MSADLQLAAAQELSSRDGLRGAVLAYMEAVDALVAEKRVAQAQSVMIELLKAQEKKKGLFGRSDKNPLGSERVTVGLKFAEIAPKGPLSEDALDQLGYLAQDFPDELTIRRANADALRRSGYAADAIDEYRYCAGAVPDDAEVNQNISELYVGIGRPDDAAGYLVRALRLYGKHGEFGMLATHAESLIELSPASLGDLVDLLSPAPGESLIGHLNFLDELAHRVMNAGILDASQKAKAREQLQALYERLALVDRGNEGAARGLEKLKADGLPVDRRRSEPSPAHEPTPTPTPAPAPAPKAAPAEKIPPVAENVPEAVADVVSVIAAKAPPAQAEPQITLEPAPRKPPAVPNALAAYTRRKATDLFNAGDFTGAAMCYERLLRSGSDIESLEGALSCYLALMRAQDAARVAVELVNAREEAGDLEGALKTIERISEVSNDSNFSNRRMELLVALGRPKAVGR